MIEVLPRPRPRRRATVSAYRISVEAVIRHMRAHPGLPLDLDGMARLANASRCHFDRLFREITGLAPRHFQTAVRLNTASRLLLTTERSVTDVCYDIGYESLGTFVATFTRTFGLPPQRLREVAAALHDPWPRGATAGLVAEFGAHASPPLLEGRIVYEAPFEGIIFVGLFPTPIPVRVPLACTIVSAPGPFTLGPIPAAGYVLAVAIPSCERPLDFLLNEQAHRGGKHVSDLSQELVLTLHPPEPLDPPMNIALPYLMAEKMAMQRKEEVTLRRDRPSHPSALSSHGSRGPDLRLR
jgi:AraC family transcriptional regulator